MAITQFSVVPSRATGQDTFSADAEVFWGQLPTFVTEVNSFIVSLNGSWTSSSTTSLLVGTGSKTLTVGTGLGFQVGMPVRLANSSTNYMTGDVTSYNPATGSLVCNITSSTGSGTYAVWSVYAIPSYAAQIVTAQIADLAVTTGKISDLAVTNAKLAQAYINDLTDVNFDPLVDYVPIADGSDSGNKKKAFINGIGAGDSKDVITDTGSNGQRTLTIDGVIRETQTASARLSTIDGGSVLYPEFKCRAWVNFNGTGTVAIRASGNVSSITDNGAGSYTVNLITALPDINFSGQITTGGTGGVHNARGEEEGTARTTSTWTIATTNTSNSPTDAAWMNVVIFR